MRMCKLTEFGLRVRTELLQRGTTQKWLEEQITEKTELFVDSSYTLSGNTCRWNYLGVKL